MSPDILYFDFETSGLDPKRHAILQAAWILERGGKVITEKRFDVMAMYDDDLCLAALDVNGFTLDRVRRGCGLAQVISTLQADLNGGPAVRPCGHNVQFDISFLFEAAHKSNIFLSGIDFTKIIDTRSIMCWLDYAGIVTGLPDCKLETVCDHFNIPIVAHDALEDVRAVRAVLARIMLEVRMAYENIL